MAEEQQHDGQKLRERGEKWTDRLRKAETREKQWADNARAADKAYACDGEAPGGKVYDFNILHSNVETIVPAIYNSTPSPDIRRRFADKDPVAKEFSEMVERAISIQIDDDRLDTEIESSAQDAFVAGRGIVRVSFNADTEDESVQNEHVSYEAVSWCDFRMGKAKRWDSVPWVAFRHSVDREELERVTDVEMYTSQFAESEKPLLSSDNEDDIHIWEIWDKSNRTVLLVREDDGAILKEEEDPLGLNGFFPMPAPVQPIHITGNMTPVCPFTVYKTLAEELDTLTKRITKLVKGIKVKGMLAGVAGADIQNLADADDNELIIASELEQMAATGGLDKAITWWPIEPAIKAVVALYQQREATKQSIYEITGISDIVRGASSSQETATAQQIKTQWGSLRIQKMQKLIQRQVRDLFVITSEIITTKFSEQTLQDMTGVQLVMTPEEQAVLSGQIPQPNEAEGQQQWQQIEQAAKKKQGLLEMLNKPVLTAYRVDIESDSTIRADMTRARGETSEFLTATGAFFTAMAPIVASSPALGEPVAEIYAAFARNYNLGKQAEDAIETLSEMAQKASKQAQQQQQQPNPEQIKAESEAKAQEMNLKIRQMDAQAKQSEVQLKAHVEQQKAQSDMQIKDMDLQIKSLELQIKQIEAQTKGIEATAKVTTANINAETAQRKADAQINQPENVN